MTRTFLRRDKERYVRGLADDVECCLNARLTISDEASLKIYVSEDILSAKVSDLINPGSCPTCQQLTVSYHFAPLWNDAVTGATRRLYRSQKSFRLTALWDTFCIRIRGISEMIVDLMTDLHSVTESAMNCGVGVSRCFHVNSGMRQDYVLTKSPFNICVDWILDKFID